tara:strand:- start:8508 stop:9326 length:819 start_codon:yes stop_codon:yes gene_type:complete
MKNFINLLKFYLIPQKIFKKIIYLINLKKYNRSIFEEKQNKIFEKIGLDRRFGIQNLNSIKKKNNLDKKRSMSSEHEVLFSSISNNKNLKIENILEIGTFDGFNALLLSKIFPESKINTIDLPDNSDEFGNSYERKNSLNDFIKIREEYLSKIKNLNFNQINSINLLKDDKKYDLIWIDGAHGYPVVTIDIINSLNLINKDGLILCDDIFLNLEYYQSDKMYKSIASFETLKALEKEKIINLELIFKRISPKENCLESERKFIAIIKKINHE